MSSVVVSYQRGHMLTISSFGAALLIPICAMLGTSMSDP